MKGALGLIGAALTLEMLVPLTFLAVVFGPNLFGVSTYVVESGSMEPQILVGSLVYVDEKVSGEEIAPNEVAAFEIDEVNAKVCTHRVIENDEGSQSIRTKGDMNKDLDPIPVPYSDITGRVVFSIPHLGALAYCVSENSVILLIAYLIASVSTLLLYRFIDERYMKANDRRRRYEHDNMQRYAGPGFQQGVQQALHSRGR